MSGTLPIALSQQFDIDGTPLAGARLYIYVVGTVATPQDSYQDYGLTLVNPWPMVADQYGRLPMFYLADGSVHVRLTDASGVVVFDYPAMHVIGPSSGGGGGGGGSVDPTAIAATGDFKWRPSSAVLPGWVKANSTNIGNAYSGADQRANADTQALFIYLWSNFSNAVCPVPGGRGASAAIDFAAAKMIGVPDLRGRVPYGLDDMGAFAAGRIPSGTIPTSSGGEASHTLTLSEVPVGQFTINDPSHVHPSVSGVGSKTVVQGGANPTTFDIPSGSTTTGGAYTGVNLTDHAGGGAHNNMPPYMLGTFYVKL